MHDRCRTTVLTLVEYEKLEADLTKYTVVNLKDVPMPTLFQKLVLLNIAAEYEAKQRFKGKLEWFTPGIGWLRIRIAISKPAEEHKAFYFTKLNIRMFAAVVEHLGHHMQIVMAQPGYHSRAPRNRVTDPMHWILPGLRHYSSWLTASFNYLHRPLPNGKFFDELRMDLGRLWNEYAKTLNILVHCFTQEDLGSQLEYLLPEDDEVVGFLPFETKMLMGRFLDIHNFRKPKPSVAPREDPEREMLARIQGLITDGMHLGLRPVCSSSPSCELC